MFVPDTRRHQKKGKEYGNIGDVLPIILCETKTVVEEEVFFCYFAFSLHLSLDNQILEHLRFWK
jgi:hypothetical protein